MRSLWLVAGYCCATSLQAATLIHAGQLIDVANAQVDKNKTIVVENNRISAVEDGFVVREGATVIDLSEATVMPGLIDTHVHLDNELDPPMSYSESYYMNSADYALRATVYARKTLEAGFTTVRDLGARDKDALFALRNAINTGIVPGPRIFAAGKSIATTGGHADPTNG